MINWAAWFQGLPPEMITFLVAMIPIAELRVSIPLALEVLHLPIPQAIFWSVAGNMIPAIAIVFWIEPLARGACRFSSTGKRCYDWFSHRTRSKFARGYAKYGAAIALVIFVGIPLPITGAWSGSLAAFLFGIPKRVALPAIFIGVCIAAVIVTIIDLGVGGLF
ncbi:MAG: small multi-drug export protein [bacterium]|nr:small multi-drug export protein [bacterium]